MTNPEIEYATSPLSRDDYVQEVARGNYSHPPQSWYDEIMGKTHKDWKYDSVLPLRATKQVGSNVVEVYTDPIIGEGYYNEPFPPLSLIVEKTVHTTGDHPSVPDTDWKIEPSEPDEDFRKAFPEEGMQDLIFFIKIPEGLIKDFRPENFMKFTNAILDMI